MTNLFLCFQWEDPEVHVLKAGAEFFEAGRAFDLHDSNSILISDFEVEVDTIGDFLYRTDETPAAENLQSLKKAAGKETAEHGDISFKAQDLNPIHILHIDLHRPVLAEINSTKKSRVFFGGQHYIAIIGKKSESVFCFKPGDQFIFFKFLSDEETFQFLQEIKVWKFCFCDTINCGFGFLLLCCDLVCFVHLDKSVKRECTCPNFGSYESCILSETKIFKIIWYISMYLVHTKEYCESLHIPNIKSLKHSIQQANKQS